MAVVGLACALGQGGAEQVVSPPTRTFSDDEIIGFLNVYSGAVADDVATRLTAGAAAMAATTLAAGTWSWIATRAFGGRTGDTLGATAALVEVVACLVLVGFWAA